MPTVTANDVGHPQAAGEYQVDGAFYQIDERHIAAWADDPEAAFRTIICTRVNDVRQRYALGGLVTE